MTYAEAWLDREKRRIEELPCLEDALLQHRAWSYVVYRLRYLFIRALLRTGLRIFELALLASSLPSELLSPILVSRSLLMLGEVSWWGALESLRTEVRHWASRRETATAVRAIRRSLAFTWMLGFGGLVLCLFWIEFAPSNRRSFSVIDAYLLACTVRWGADVFAGTLHAGAYAVRRVFRPWWSLVMVDIADVVVLGLCYWWLGAWGIALALALVGCLRSGLSILYTRRVYDHLKYEVGGPRAWFTAWRNSKTNVRFSGSTVSDEDNPWRFAWANLLGQADAWIVLALLAPAHTSGGPLLLAALFHVLSPLLGVASTWSRLFYFDFKRLQGWGSSFLLERFEVLLDRVTRWLALPIGLVVLALLAAFWRGPFWLLALELTALSALRARLSLVHQRAYALGDHAFMMRVAVVVSGVTGVAYFASRLPAEWALATLCGVTTIGLMYLGRSRRPLPARQPRGIVSPSRWLEQVLRVEEPLRLWMVRVDRRLTTVGRLHQVSKDRLPNAVFTRLGNDTLVWYVAGPLLDAPGEPFWAGTVKEFERGAVAKDGAQAVALGLESAAWRAAFRDAAPLASHAPLEGLQGYVSSRLDGALLVTLGPRTNLRQFDERDSRELRRLLLAAAQGRRGFRKLRTGEVAVIAPADRPTALLVVPHQLLRHTATRSELLALLQKTEISLVCLQR